MMLRSILAACAVLATFASGALAEDKFPSRPITIIVPFAAGGPSDAMARILAERMKVTLGQPLLVENVTGAAARSASVARRIRRLTATSSASAILARMSAMARSTSWITISSPICSRSRCCRATPW